MFIVEHLKSDGTATKVEISKKKDVLKQLQRMVGGNIELVRNVRNLPEGKILLANEEGRLLRLRRNPHIQGIVGNAIIMNDSDFD